VSQLPERLGAEHPETLKVIAELAKRYAGAGRSADAAKLYVTERCRHS
jgi:hypothetical protein